MRRIRPVHVVVAVAGLGIACAIAWRCMSNPAESESSGKDLLRTSAERVPREGAPAGRSPADASAPRQTAQAPAPASAVPGETVEARLDRARDADWMSLRAVVAECAALDPRSTAAWAASSLPAGGERAFAVQCAVRKWTSREPQEVLAWALKLSPGEGREGALRDLFYAWASISPQVAAEQLKLVPEFETRSLAIAAIAWHWAAGDLNAATKWAWDLPEDAGRTYALANIARRLFFSDPETAKEWAQKLPAGRARNAAILEMAGFLARKDPVTAADWISKQIPGGPGPDPAYQVLVAHWAAGNPAEAVAWASQLPDDLSREHALATVAQALAASRPGAAAELAASMAAGTKRQDTFRRIARDWARSDASAAADWAASLPPGPEKQAAQEEVAQAETASRSAGTGSSAAAPTAPADSGGGGDEGGANRLSPEVFRSPWWELVPLVEQLPDGVLRDGLAHRTAVLWAEEAPAAAAAWISEQLPQGRALDTALRVIVWNWTVTNAAAAAAWAESREDPRAREQAVLSSAMALARSSPDPAAIGGLLDSLDGIPAGDTRKQAIGNIAYQWARTAGDISVVTNWAWGLSEEEGRSVALEKIAKAEGEKK